MPLNAHTVRMPVTEPPREPDDAPGPVVPDSSESDDSVESPEPARAPGKQHGAVGRHTWQ